MGAQRAPPPMRRKARHRAGRRKVLRYGLPLLGLVLAGYGGLTLVSSEQLTAQARTTSH